MRQLVSIVLGILLFGVLGARASTNLAPRIERDLTARVQASLREANIPENKATVDGRDVWVDPTYGQEPAFAQISAALAGVPGLRRIRARTGPQAPPPEGRSAHVVVAWSGSMMDLRGALSAEADSGATLSTLRQQFSELSITDSLTIDPDLTALPWEGRLSAVVALVREAVPNGIISVRGEEFVVQGTVVDPNLRTEVGERLAAELPGMDVVNRIAVPNQSGPVEMALVQILGGRMIGFEHQSDRLTAESQSLLERVAVVLEDYPDVNVRIEGYSEDNGRPTQSFVLSRVKADVVRDFLIRGGAHADALVVRAMGAADPAEGEPENAGRAQVRLVVDRE